MSDGCVVITGIGPVSSLGVGRAGLAAALREAPTARPIGELNLADHITSAKTYLDPNSAQALVSVALALEDAHLVIDGTNSTSVGMSFGTRLGNVTTTESYLKMVREQGVKLASPLLFIHAYPNTSVSLCAIEFGIRGTSINFNSGRVAGLQALIQASDELRTSGMSVMLAGASDTYTEVTRPGSLGTPLGGATTVVLERAAAALERGARALVEVAGGGMADEPERALARALTEARVGRPEIDWLLVDAPADARDRLSLGGHVTDMEKLAGDAGAATALLAVALCALVMHRDDPPATLGLMEVPRAAAVLTSDQSGAAAVVLRRLTD